MSGISERAIINYENDVNEAPLGAAYRLATALGSSVDDLLKGSATMQRGFEPASTTDLLTQSIELQERALLQLRRGREVADSDSA